MSDQRKRQLFLIGAAVLAVISLLAGWYFTLRKGLYLGDDFYYKVSETMYRHDKANYIERTSDTDFKIISDTDERTASIHAENDLMTFDFSDGEDVAGTWNGQYLSGDDNLPLGWDDITVTASYSPGSSLYGTETKPPISNLAYSYALLQIYLGQYETMYIWYGSVFGIIMYIFGILIFLYPEQTYFLFSRWMYQDPELSEAGILAQRIGAVTVCIAGVVFMSGIPVLFV